MTVRIHRRLNGLRSLFRRMSADHSAGMAERLRGDAGHFVQRFDEIDHDVVELRDRARLLQDEITIKLAEQTNRNLHILSVVTALLLPPTLVTGLFGMNVEGLPFTGSPHGFWWVAGMALAVAAVAAWILGLMGMFGKSVGGGKP
jgi:zinc transporter